MCVTNFAQNGAKLVLPALLILLTSAPRVGKPTSVGVSGPACRYFIYLRLKRIAPWMRCMHMLSPRRAKLRPDEADFPLSDHYFLVPSPLAVGRAEHHGQTRSIGTFLSQERFSLPIPT